MARPSQAGPPSSPALPKPVSSCSTSVSSRGRKRSSLSTSGVSQSSASSSESHAGCLRVSRRPRIFTTGDSSPSNKPKINLPGSSMVLMSGPAKKLDRMLSLIQCTDVQFFNDPGISRIEFAIKKKPRVVRLAKMERLRSLIALAHHFDEQDGRRAINLSSDGAIDKAI